METSLTSSQDRIPEEEPDADSHGILSMMTVIWTSQSSEEYQAADCLKDLRIFSPSPFDSMELFKRTSIVFQSVPFYSGLRKALGSTRSQMTIGISVYAAA